jgi:hypothetical protein
MNVCDDATAKTHEPSLDIILKKVLAIAFNHCL